MAGDLEIVQYALTLEHLETDFYNAVIDAGVIKDKALAETAKMIRDNEQEHVDALTGDREEARRHAEARRRRISTPCSTAVP